MLLSRLKCVQQKCQEGAVNRFLVHKTEHHQNIHGELSETYPL